MTIGADLEPRLLLHNPIFPPIICLHSFLTKVLISFSYILSFTLSFFSFFHLTLRIYQAKPIRKLFSSHHILGCQETISELQWAPGSSILFYHQKELTCTLLRKEKLIEEGIQDSLQWVSPELCTALNGQPIPEISQPCKLEPAASGWQGDRLNGKESSLSTWVQRE